MEPGAPDVHPAPIATATTSDLPPPPALPAIDPNTNEPGEQSWDRLYAALYEHKTDLEKRLEAARTAHQEEQDSWRRERSLWDAERDRRKRDLSAARRELEMLKQENADLKREATELQARENHLDGSPTKRRRPSGPHLERIDFSQNGISGEVSPSQSGAQRTAEDRGSNPDAMVSDPPSPPASTAIPSPPPIAYRRHAGHTPAAIDLLTPRVKTPNEQESPFKGIQQDCGTGTTDVVDAHQESGQPQDATGEATQPVGHGQQDGHTSHTHAPSDLSLSTIDQQREGSHLDGTELGTAPDAPQLDDPVHHLVDDPALSGPLYLPTNPESDPDGILAALEHKLEEAAISPEARTPSVLKGASVTELPEPDSLHGLSDTSQSNGGLSGGAGVVRGPEFHRRTSKDDEEIDPAMDLDENGGAESGEMPPLDVPIKLRPTMNFGAPLGSLR